MKPTPKQKKLLIAALVAGLVALAVYLYLRNRRLRRSSSLTQPAGVPLDSSPIGVAPAAMAPARMFANCPSESFPLMRGMCGPNVERVQIHLIRKFGIQLNYGADGKWGDETEQAVVKHVMHGARPGQITRQYFDLNQIASIPTTRFR